MTIKPHLLHWWLAGRIAKALADTGFGQISAMKIRSDGADKTQEGIEENINFIKSSGQS
jgi:hypothetical protein